ncbi:MAG: NAD(P)/FAD-dependent oxidoreductase [Synechococcales cyanobacterium M58_A2018_015]|nr:NAD(P)/FAD-dependent oxidoreductase [Synechococcales cyanobacterium M58_A2018_015]
MARSILIQLLQRAYRVACQSAQTQRPVSDLDAELTEVLSRRQVLGGLIAGAIGMSTHWQHSSNRLQPVAQRPTESDPKVLIVGAGIAGLTAGYRLQQAGVPVTIIEATHRTGGRLVSLTNFPSDLGTVELGGEFIDSRHTHVRSLAAELGLELADLREADTGLEPEILYFQGKQVSRTTVIEEFAPLARRINQDLQTLSTRTITYHAPSPHAVQLDRLSLADYLQQDDVSPLINQLVRVAYITEFGRDAESQSCLNMLFLIGAEVGKWDTYGISDERYHVIGGNDQIPKELTQRLDGSIELGTVLESIRVTSDGRYRVSLRRESTSHERVYDQVLLTVPFSVLRQVDLAIELPPVKQRAIKTLGYGTSSKLAVPYRERIWRTRYGCAISIYTDMDFQNTWESARYAPGPGGWVTDLRGGKQGILLGAGHPDTHAHRLTQDLENIFPGISQVERGTALRAVWSAEPYALGSYSCYLPGQWTAIGGSEGEQVGKLWFAGEHCSLGSQGYMNGACETAEIAAQGMLQQLGRTAQIA